MIALARFYLVAAWTFFILLLTTSPMPTGNPGEPDYMDKVAHFFLFAVFAYLFYRYIVHYFSFILAQILALIASASFAIVIELLQFYVPGRDMSFFDFLAGAVGAVFAMAVLWLRGSRKPKLLLHVCCIGCGAYVSKVLAEDFRVVLFFYNPNIFPREEYDRRLNEAKRIARRFSLKMVSGEYEHEAWLSCIRGHEQDRERGERCFICYRQRLEETAKRAKQGGFEYFTSTLSVSPHKDAAKLSQIGNELAEKFSLKFLDRDFKKKDGFKKSVAMSRDLGLYRQDYCGCEFSMRDRKA